MYIQPPVTPSTEDFSLPRGYSGNAFRRAPAEQEPSEPVPTPPPATAAEAGDAPSEQGAAPVCEPPMLPPREEKTTPVMGHTEKPPKGLLGRLPFLSSLLPPPRSAGSRGGVLPEWLLIGAVILLFLSEDEGSDILPLLLLLLLWD